MEFVGFRFSFEIHFFPVLWWWYAIYIDACNVRIHFSRSFLPFQICLSHKFSVDSLLFSIFPLKTSKEMKIGNFAFLCSFSFFVRFLRFAIRDGSILFFTLSHSKFENKENFWRACSLFAVWCWLSKHTEIRLRMKKKKKLWKWHRKSEKSINNNTAVDKRKQNLDQGSVVVFGSPENSKFDSFIARFSV